MDFTQRMRILRAIERAAQRYGLASDATVDPADLPGVGTRNQQFSIIALGLESGVRISDLSTRDREWVGELLRSCVFNSSPRNVVLQSVGTRPKNNAAMSRAWRRK